MSIYILTHKPFSAPCEEGYKTILVGAYKGHILGEDVSNDDIGDNISEKNANYCELTGIYWLWKHCKDSYVGLVHYRRFFSRYFFQNKILKEKDVIPKLEKYDIILPFKRTLPLPVGEEYCNVSGYKKDLDKLGEIIKEKYPDCYACYQDTLAGNKVYFANMMICKKELFDEYCSWLFDLLFELEKHVDMTGYNDYQKRIYGFLSERLLTVYVNYRNLKVFEMGVICPEENWSMKKKFLTGMKRKLLYYLQ